jgi:hypothetical protein
MGKPEDVRDDPVVTLQIHRDDFGHGRGKKASGGVVRLGHSQIHQHDMAARQELGIRAEHRMDRGDPDPRAE